jgi:glutathione peroxidase
LSEKISVTGEKADPLFKYLAEEKPFEKFTGPKGLLMKGITKAKAGDKDIEWNFTKFLVDREGDVVKRYEPTTEPKDIAKDIETLL